ncbi:formyltetrahydrofolate deformylase [Thiorhodovibrio frisius]|uniref:Formyltetrahydrofolate deformylase n=1 Tax=Thiorhodovibrio frisius TaxID=631362 RepID=H8Z6T7_9GAMM|nr:formyltetrahydrofolate deformylase [Thiorhodovibrio frisius]EIC20803.1 formyltetrahydrofolate deformylase [Thiorhodovibrio frisius]WPL21854.1 Formyltetrahydrofolate deformylase [Thiorhodovibrio frisius]
MERTYRLVISCPDQAGIVAAVSDFIARLGGWITEAHHYTDPGSQWFFMRYVVRADSIPFELAEFRARFALTAQSFGMHWFINDSGIKPRVVLLASKQAHCLSDLLYRWRSHELDCEIPAVLSNHDDLRGYVEWHGIAYHHLAVDPGNKDQHFAAVRERISDARADVIVLARYMQILPPELCAEYPARIINIHHSFLPSFVGARPYHQASERGVKLIGATCHYVTRELDAGPIIEQDVVRVNHHNTVEDMVRLGRDVEKMVLARGLRYHLEDRVLVHGNKTIVFA